MKTPGPRNGASDVQFFGSALSTDALRILASMRPEELRALDRHVNALCLYGKDEWHAMLAARKLHAAAEVCG